MSLTLNYQYRIYPDATQTEQLLEWLETARRVYNFALRQVKDYKNSRKCSLAYCSLHSEYIIPADHHNPTYYWQQNQLPKAKKDYPRLSVVPSQVLQTTIRRLHDAWDFFYKRGYGSPRFKKVGQMKSLLFPQFKQPPIVPPGRRDASGRGVWQIKLPKLGLVQMNLHRPIPVGFEVKQASVIRKADYWYVVITIASDISIPEPLPHGRAVGVDVGLSKFLATSDALEINPPRFFKTLQSELKLLQRRLARKTKRSNNYLKALIKVQRLHHRIANARKNFHYAVAHRLCDDGGMMFVEDLDYRVSAKGMLGKHMLDAAFGQFRSILKQVCFKRGVYFDEVDARGTSCECPNCRASWNNDLSIRWHKCDECGLEIDRDQASAIVIRERGLAKLPQDLGETKEPVQSVCRGRKPR